MKKSVYIYTYGCQMNVHDSEKMLGTLVHDGYTAVADPANADLIIFNTCAIREKAEQKFYSQLGRIKHLKKKNPLLKIAVAGCIAQDSGKGVSKRAPYVDFVLGPQNIHMVRELDSSMRSICVEDNPSLSTQEYDMERGSSSRAWVAIMYGCNNFCSYCIVPYTRGREKSRPSSMIIAEIIDLKEKGYREVTLLGQNVNSYRSDLDFVGLLRAIDRTGIERIRFVTSHPRDLSPDLIDAIAELPSVCEHMHLPLQSGSDSILKAMNRGYTFDAYRKKIDLLRKGVPSIAISTDIIVGFPGESDDDFEKTLRAVEEIEYDGIFAFNYSKRKGTKAELMDRQVPDDTKIERLNKLLYIQDDIALKNNRKLQKSMQQVLVEGQSETDASVLMGRTRSNKIVTLDDNGECEGDLFDVVIEKARHHSLHGKRI